MVSSATSAMSVRHFLPGPTKEVSKGWDVCHISYLCCQMLSLKFAKATWKHKTSAALACDSCVDSLNRASRNELLACWSLLARLVRYSGLRVCNVRCQTLRRSDWSRPSVLMILTLTFGRLFFFFKVTQTVLHIFMLPQANSKYWVILQVGK